MRPIRVIAPEGLVVNCQYPCTVGASPVNVGIQVMESVLEALSKARPERAIAAWAKHRGEYVFAADPRTGERYVRTSFDYDGSGGAVWGYDGFVGVSCLTALGAVNRGNVEETETRIPWTQLKYELAADFSGNGRWQGGPGVIWEAVNDGSDGGMATGSSDGDEVLGFGAVGGEPSPPCRTYLKRGDEMIRIKPHRLVPIKHGDILIKQSSGGGGVGVPWERDVEAVREDVRNGIVTLKTALDVYRVAIDPVTFDIDQARTRQMREQAAKLTVSS